MIAPYMAKLRERQRHGNLPVWVNIHVGVDAWERAKAPPGENCLSSVWDGGRYAWPVRDCFVRVEVDDGPSDGQCRDFAVDLITQGAAVVVLWWFDRMPIAYFADGEIVELEISDLRQVFGNADEKLRSRPRHNSIQQEKGGETTTINGDAQPGAD